MRQRRQSYTANNLNQYTQRTVPGYLDMIGTATNTATVTVNHVATSRKSSYYRGEVPVANSGSAVWQSISNVAVLANGTNDYVTNWNGNLFLPASVESFGYDADGNMTNDGRWALTWDGENRLIKMESLGGAPIDSSNQLIFVYDHQSRRMSKAVQTFTSGAWTITLSNRFVYDGWNLLAELNATNNMVINSFVWGWDLSGTMQGAGGVGGLLASRCEKPRVPSMQGAGGVGGLLAITTTNAGTHFAGCDGNGNVAMLVSASSGTATANYEYDPFGNVLRATGPMALPNPFRFSTKYTDSESAFNYYGYRFYSPTAGRWVARDPIDERGGLGLYGFAENNQVNRVDGDGRSILLLFFLTGCSSPCDDPCGAAKKKGLGSTGYGFVVCCRGRKYSCVNSPGVTKEKKAQKIATTCIMLHESTHHDDINCPPGEGVTQPPFKPGVNENAAECWAYKMHLNCLQNHITDCGGDSNCESDVNAEISRVEKNKRDTCGEIR